MKPEAVTCENYEDRFIDLIRRIEKEKMDVETLQAEIIPEADALEAHLFMCRKCQRNRGALSVLGSPELGRDRQTLIDIYRTAKNLGIPQHEIPEILREWKKEKSKKYD